MALFTSRSATIRLLDPITSTALITLTTQLRNLDTGESPEYAERGYHRSGSVSSVRKRSLGSLAIDKTPDGMALVRVLKQWQQGVSYFPLASDLKGRTYRHPNLEISMTDAGTTEVITAHGVRLASRSFGLPLSGPASDSISLDVLRGFDLSTSDAADNYEPKRALDFHRTGSKSYINTAGTLTTATDGQAAIGLPWVVRRNLINISEDFDLWPTKTNTTVLANQKYAAITGIGSVLFDKITSTVNGGYVRTNSLTVGNVLGRTFTFSVWVVADSTQQVSIRFSDLVSESSPTVTVTATTTPQRVTVSHTFATGTNTVIGPFVYPGSDVGTGTAYFYGAQLESASTATPYQPTNATGPDITNSLNGAGLVLEGAGTNLVAYSEAFDDAWWSKTRASITANQLAAPDGTTTMDKLIEDATASNSHYLRRSALLANGVVYTLSVFAKAGTRSQIFLSPNWTGGAIAYFDLSAGRVISTAGGVTAGMVDHGSGIYRCWITCTGSSGVNEYFDAGLAVSGAAAYTGDGASFAYLWGGQAEASPFLTSYIKTSGATATRNADLCGIVAPHNELKHSHDLTQGAAGSGTWNRTAGASVAKSGSDNTLTLAATTDAIYQAVTPSSVPSTTRTAAARLKLGTLSGSVLLRLLDQSGNVIASTTVTTATLSASEYRTFYVTGTAASDDTGLRVQIIGNSGTGTILVRSLGLVQGNHPGVEVTTGDTAIPAPVSPALDPAWVQNGYIEGYILLPAGSPPNLVTVGHVGATQSGVSAGDLRLYRTSSAGSGTQQLNFDRKHNGASGFGAAAGRGLLTSSTTTVYDLAPHKFRLEWGNETIVGVRSMPQTLKLWSADGSTSETITQDVAALYGASSWGTPDATKLIADGSNYATLSNLTIGYRTITAGATPAV